MSDITLVPGLEISAEEFFVVDTTLATGEQLTGQISQAGSLDMLGQGQIVTHWSEYAFTLGERTFRYLGDFISTVDQSLVGSVSSITGNFSGVVIEDASGTIAQLDLDALVGIDFGSVTSLNLLGLDLGEITSGLVDTLLGDGPNSILSLITGSTASLLETVQGLIDDENSSPEPVDVSGDDNADDLRGRTGDDHIRGLGGDDVLRGHEGNDSIVCDAGNDQGYGDAGNDYLRGGAGLDQLWGGEGDDELYGDQQNDKLYGDTGNDRLIGGTGVDFLFGGDGDDFLFAGKSLDRMSGGAGADTFVFATAKDSFKKGDLISDFSLADGDQIDLSHFKHAEFIGRHKMSEDRGEIQVSYKGSDTYVRGDFNGDGRGEFVVHLDGHLKLNADDFIW
jgi:Ca2+-binding RTX toxin-like protein